MRPYYWKVGAFIENVKMKPLKLRLLRKVYFQEKSRFTVKELISILRHQCAFYQKLLMLAAGRRRDKENSHRPEGGTEMNAPPQASPGVRLPASRKNFCVAAANGFLGVFADLFISRSSSTSLNIMRPPGSSRG